MRKTVSLLLCLVMMLGIFAVSASASATEPEKSSLTLADCDGKKIGVLTGSIHDSLAKQYFPHAEIQYFTTVSDMITAVLSGTIDGFSNDILSTYALLNENDRLAYIDDALAYIPTAYAFPKTDEGAALRDQMNDFMAAMEADGTLKALQDKWLSYTSGDYDLDLTGLDGNEKTVVFATSCSGKPNAYYYNGAPTGYEVEIVAMFCREYGYDLDIQVTDFAGIIPGLASGKYDIGADGIAVTEERAQSVHFSTPDYNSAVVMIVQKDKRDSSALPVFTSLDQLNAPDVNLGIVTGMATDAMCAEFFPEAGTKYFNNIADALYALSIGQVDGYMIDEPMCRYLVAHNEGLVLLDGIVGDILDTAFVLGKTDFDEQLKVELNEYIAKLKADGTIDKLLELWYGTDGDNQVLTIPIEGENGTVKAAVSTQAAPAVMLVNGQIAGVEIDILSRFCKEYGYALELTDMDFSGLINGVNSGRFNIASAYISITDERRESVNFSDPYISSGCRMIVRAPDAGKTGFWASLSESFERTFIKEDRWKLIVRGIETTMIISVCAAALGTLLGFGLCLLRRMNDPVIHGFTTVYIRILQGTPLLVLLMILYYIVFAKSGLSGELVAIFAFALNFAAYVCEMFRTGIDSVDKGQTEAAYAIGFTKSQTFFRIVMPQAATHFLPVYKGEFISLVKMTSIVGYIAVQDLTKMSDIIRSRTYDPFFPLIATAIIYFILSSLLTALLKAVEINVLPKRDKRIVKGVKMQ